MSVKASLKIGIPMFLVKKKKNKEKYIYILK
jgi:hypothetical protein